MANEYKSIYTGTEVDAAVSISKKALTSDNVVQTTGPSQTNVMSQSAVTAAIQQAQFEGSGTVVTVNGVEQETWNADTKINVFQGEMNAGKFLSVGQDGNVVLSATSSGGTVVNINNTPQSVVNFNSDPQEQITTNTNNITTLTDEYNDLSTELSTEITNRENADNTLQNNINEEISNREEADTLLDTKIDDLKDISVLTTPQTLTPEQQTQVKSNLNISEGGPATELNMTSSDIKTQTELGGDLWVAKTPSANLGVVIPATEGYIAQGVVLVGGTSAALQSNSNAETSGSFMVDGANPKIEYMYNDNGTKYKTLYVNGDGGGFQYNDGEGNTLKFKNAQILVNDVPISSGGGTGYVPTTAIKNEPSSSTSDIYSAKYVQDNFTPRNFIENVYLSRTGVTTANLTDAKPSAAAANYMTATTTNTSFSFTTPNYVITRTLLSQVEFDKQDGIKLTLNCAFSRNTNLEFGANILMNGVAISSNQAFGLTTFNGNNNYDQVTEFTLNIFMDLLTTPTTYPAGTVLTIQLFTRQVSSQSLTTRVFCGVDINGVVRNSYASLNFSGTSINTSQIADNAITTPKIADNAVTQSKINGLTATIQQLNYSSNVTSDIQTQINGKENSFSKNTAFNKNFGTTTPTMNGTGNAGTSNDVSRADHVHPSDTTKANIGSSNTFTGDQTIKGVLIIDGETFSPQIYFKSNSGPQYILSVNSSGQFELNKLKALTSIMTPELSVANTAPIINFQSTAGIGRTGNFGMDSNGDFTVSGNLIVPDVTIS